MSEYSVDPQWKRIYAMLTRVAADSANPQALEAWHDRNDIWKAMVWYARNKKENHPDYWQLKNLYDELSPLADQVGPPQVPGLVQDAAGYKDLALLPFLALSPGVTSPAEPTEQVEQQQFPTGWEHYADKVDAAAAKYEVPADMFWRLLKTENDVGNPRARNPSGAMGLGQIMPDTAAEFGIDPYNPDQAIDASAKYLRALNREFGNWDDAVAAYNWGPGKMKEYLSEGGNMPGETQKYLKKISPPA